MKTKTLKTAETFKVGKHDIGYLSSDFLDHFPATFAPKAAPTFQTLAKSMADEEIEKELKPGLCELGDILAFLENPPKGTRDSYANLFYTSSCFVGVLWRADDRGWDVRAWRRGGRSWRAGRRVFSPATAAQARQEGREEFIGSFAMPMGDIPKGEAESIADFFLFLSRLVSKEAVVEAIDRLEVEKPRSEAREVLYEVKKALLEETKQALKRHLLTSLGIETK